MTTEAQPSSSSSTPETSPPSLAEVELLDQIVISRIRDEKGRIQVITQFSDEVSVPDAAAMIGLAQMEMFVIATDNSVTDGPEDIDDTTDGTS